MDISKKHTILISALFAAIFAIHAETGISLTIEQAYELCLEHSLELRTSRLEILAERQRITLGRWESLPSLSVNLSDSRLTRYNAPDNTAIRVSSALTVPIFNGGRVRIQRKIDTLQNDLQTLLLSASEEELKNSCFIHFHELHLLSLKCAALEKTGRLAEKHHEISKKEYELGRAREIDVVETRLYLEEISQTLFCAETEKLAHEAALRKLINLDTSLPIYPVSLISKEYTGLNLEDSANRLHTCAQEKNQAIRQNRYLLEQARMQNRLVNSRWLPDIQLQATVQLNGEDYPLQYPDYGVRVFVEFPNDLLPVNVSFGISTTPEREYGRTFSSGVQTPLSLQPIVEKRVAATRLSLALETGRELQRNLRYSLEEAMLSHERQRRSQELLRHRITTQETKAAILGKQAELGQITRLEYLEGENELLTSRLQYLSGVFDLLRMERTIASLVGIDPADLAQFGRKE